MVGVNNLKRDNSISHTYKIGLRYRKTSQSWYQDKGTLKNAQLHVTGRNIRRDNPRHLYIERKKINLHTGYVELLSTTVFIVINHVSDIFMFYLQ